MEHGFRVQSNIQISPITTALLAPVGQPSIAAIAMENLSVHFTAFLRNNTQVVDDGSRPQIRYGIRFQQEQCKLEYIY